MNGLNKQNKRLKYILYIAGGIYILLFIAFFLLLMNFSKIQNDIDTRRVNGFKDNLQLILNSNIEDKYSSINQLVEQKYVQVAITDNNNQKVYANTNTTDFSILKQSVNPEVTFHESLYTVNSDNQDYQVWVLFYNKVNSNLVTTIIIVFVLSFIFLCLILVVLVKTTFSKIVNPLTKLRDNIFKLKNYRLNEVRDEGKEIDILSKSLEEFTVDLQGKINNFGVNYTELEKDLRTKEEISMYTQQIISSLIHDLKTPINTSNLILELEMSKSGIEQSVVEKLVKQNEAVVTDINEILRVLYDEQLEHYGKEDIDLVSVIKDSLRGLAKLFKSRKIKYSIDLPASEEVNINKVEIKSIINNALVNIYNYADENSSFHIIGYEKENHFIVKFYNDVADTSSIDFENIFELFYRGKSNNKSGSGLGMYIIKAMLLNNEGDCDFYPKDNGVELMIILPLKGSDN